MAEGQRFQPPSPTDLDMWELCLFRALGCSETALRLAKAYIRCKNEELQAKGSKFGACDYLKVYIERRNLYVSSELSIISTVCKITLGELIERDEDYGASVATFLLTMSHFAAGDVPLVMLSKLANSRQELESIIQILEEYSFVKWNRDAGVLLVDDLIRQANNRELDLKNCTLSIALEAVTDTDSTTIQHALEVWNRAARSERLPKELLEASTHIVVVYLDLGDYGAARDFGQRALKFVKKAFEPNHSGLLKLEELVRSIPLAKETAVEKLRLIEESKHDAQQQPERMAEFLTQQHKLAVEMASNAKGALKVLREVYEKRLGSLGPSHKETLLTKGHIARLEYQLNRRKCDECYNVLVDVLEVLGDGTEDDCEEVALILRSLSKMLARRGEFDEALTRLRVFLNKHRELLKSDTRMIFLKGLGGILEKKHDYREALDVFTELHKLQLESLGPNHFGARRTLSRLGNVKVTLDNSNGCQFMRELFLSETFHRAAKLIEQGDFRQARDLLGLIKHPKLPSNSSIHLIAIALQSKAEALNDMMLHVFRDIEEAQRIGFYDRMGRHMSHFDKSQVHHFQLHYETALELLGGNEYEASCKAFASSLMTERRSSAFEDVIKLKTQCDHALARRDSKDFEKSLCLFKEVFEKQEELLGPDDVVTLNTQHEMAEVLRELNRHKDATEHFRHVYEKREHLFGPKHLETVMAQHNVAKSLAAQGDYQEALDIFSSVLDERAAKLELSHPHTLVTQYYMAYCLSRQGKHYESVKLFRKVHSVQMRVLGASHPDTLKTKVELELSEKRLKQNPQCYRGISQALNKYTTSKTRDLHRSINEGNVEAVENLLCESVDITQAVTGQGWTPLHTATLKGNVQMVEVILACAEQHLDEKKFHEFVNAQTTPDRNTALHLAAEKGHLKVARSLLQHKAIYGLTNEQGKRPVDVAATTKIGKLLRLIDELFEGTMRGTNGVLNVIDGLSVENIRVVYNARNTQNQSLTVVATWNEHTDLASKLLKCYEEKTTNRSTSNDSLLSSLP